MLRVEDAEVAGNDWDEILIMSDSDPESVLGVDNRRFDIEARCRCRGGMQARPSLDSGVAGRLDRKQ